MESSQINYREQYKTVENKARNAFGNKSGQDNGGGNQANGNLRASGREKKMKSWKELIMYEVAQEMQVIQQAYKEALQTQRNEFRAELEKVNKRLHHLEEQSPTSENGTINLETTSSKMQNM